MFQTNLHLAWTKFFLLFKKKPFLVILCHWVEFLFKKKKFSSFIFYFLNFLPTKLTNLIFFSFIFTLLILFTIFVLFKKCFFSILDWLCLPLIENSFSGKNTRAFNGTNQCFFVKVWILSCLVHSCSWDIWPFITSIFNQFLISQTLSLFCFLLFYPRRSTFLVSMFYLYSLIFFLCHLFCYFGLIFFFCYFHLLFLAMNCYLNFSLTESF